MDANQQMAKAARLMLEGGMTEATPEEQADFCAAKADILEVLAKYGDAGKVALHVVTFKLTEDGV